MLWHVGESNPEAKVELTAYDNRQPFVPCAGSTLTSKPRRVIHEILTIRKEAARRGVEPRGGNACEIPK